MDYALIRDLLDEHLAGPLEDTIFTPRSFDIGINHEDNITRVRIRGVPEPGWYCFDFLWNERISGNGSLRVKAGYRRNGIGAGLVRVREDLCRHEGIERIVIGENFRDTFWEHRGYQSIPTHELFRFRHLQRKRILAFTENQENRAPPRYKLL